MPLIERDQYEELSNYLQMFTDINTIISKPDFYYLRADKELLINMLRKLGHAEYHILHVEQLWDAEGGYKIFSELYPKLINIYSLFYLQVKVITPVAFGDEIKKRIVDIVFKRTGARYLELDIEINSNLIIGMIIKYADTTIDSSLDAILDKHTYNDVQI